jgi:hypothetical protein
MQLNFNQEAENMKKLKKCFEDTPCIIVPDIFFMSDNKCRLKSGFAFFNFIAPTLIIPHFIDGKLFT